MEIWKDVDGYEEFYQVSNLGRIRSLDRMVQEPKKTRLVKGRILKQGKNGAGYLYLSAQDGINKPKNLLSHRLVAQHFIPNPENKRTVNHKNGIKTDNRVENLEWNTYSENLKHAFKLGLSCKTGEKSGFSKLTEKQVLEIRSTKGTNKSIAEKYGLNESSISYIKNRKTWKHI